jgi:diguanylate cyclase
VRIFVDESSTQHPLLNVADRDYFRRTLRERLPIVSAPLPSRLSGQPVIIFTFPLENAKGVFGALRLSSLDLLVVTDSRGRILAHPERDRLLQSLSAEPRLASAFRQWVAAGSAVEPSGLRLAQPMEVVSAAGVAGPDWMIWRATPEAALLAPLRSARAQALAWAAGLVGLMSALMLVLLWWLLRPLTLLEHRAQNLFNAAGDPHAGWPEGAGEIGRLARVLRHVGAERAQLEWMATHDALTGLANRMELEQRLERVVRALPRSMPAAVVVIDLDHFKPINDTSGHTAGHSMLKAVAAAITSHVRASDLVVRLGATSSPCCWNAARTM